MNAFILMLAIKNHLERELKSLPLESRLRSAPEMTLAVPKVFLGSLPAKTALDAYEAPFVLIQAMNGNDGADGFANAEIALRFAIYNDDLEGGENDLHNFVAFCRHSLMAFRQLPLEEKFVLADHEGAYLPWTRPDSQAAPFLEAYVLSHWRFQGFE